MKTRLYSLVGFSPLRDSLKTEVLAGLTTFATMSYILALMPVMFAPLAAVGFPVGTVFTATALATIVGTLLMAFLARKPFGQAPGLSLNVFFIETVCLSMGYSWRFALTAVLIEGLLFVLLCLSNMRQVIFVMVPASLKYAIAVGIGFFVAMIGMKNSGILATGTVFNHINTLTSPSSLLFLLGLVLTGVFATIRLRGGLLLSIIIVTLAGIPLGVTKLPDTLFSLPESPAPLFCQFSWSDLLMPDLWVCVLTMLFFDIFDSLGTTVGIMATSGSIRKDGRIPHLQRIMLSDAIGTVGGACLGTSTVTTYVESATGVAQGGRTGMTALVVALCFTLSLFFAPLFLAIPAAATAPVLVVAGFYLFGSVRHISGSRPKEVIPAFLCILLMPITGSITDGIIFGLATYIILSILENWAKHFRKPTTPEADEAGTELEED
jgi:AGZA family xanthine/uracil permease-like MFS transporter